MGIWLCNHLPWHKWIARKKLSSDSERLTCSCGRMYGMNHHVRTILPWDDVKDLYRFHIVEERDEIDRDLARVPGDFAACLQDFEPFGNVDLSFRSHRIPQVL